MLAEHLSEAGREAERLLRRISALRDRMAHEETDYALTCGSPESGAVKRASMDLTRALARLRGRSR